MENKNIVSFMNIYMCVLKDFLLDDDKYIIDVFYKDGIFNLNIYNETKKINAFHKSMILSLKDSTKLKNYIRHDFINNHDIYLPCMYSFYGKTTHIIKNHKFILNIDVLDNELDDMEISQKRALKKMLEKPIC